MSASSTPHSATITTAVMGPDGGSLSKGALAGSAKAANRASAATAAIVIAGARSATKRSGVRNCVHTAQYGPRRRGA